MPRARHLVLGLTDEDPDRVFRACLEAGRAALKSFAYADGYDFLSHAHALARDPSWELSADLATACHHLQRAEEAGLHAERALESCPDPLQRARLCTMLAQIRLSEFDDEGAQHALDRALAELGRKRPRQRRLSIALRMAGFLAGELGLRLPAPASEQARFQALARVYQSYAIQRWYAMDYEGALGAGVRSGTCARRLGPSSELAYCYCLMAYLSSLLKLRPGIDYFIGKAERLATDLEDRKTLVQAQVYRGTSLQLAGDAVGAEKILAGVLQNSARWLGSLDHSMASSHLVWNLLSRGRAQSALHWIEEMSRRHRLSNQPLNPNEDIMLHDYHFAAMAWLGRHAEAEESLRRVQEKQPGASRHLLAHQLGYHLHALVERGALGEPLDEVLERFDALQLVPWMTPLPRRHGFLHKAYAWQARVERSEHPPLGRFEEAVAELGRAAGSSLFRAHHRVLQATRLRLRGQPEKALGKLATAEPEAARTASPWAAFELALERARCLRALGSEEMAASSAHQAWVIARSEGWQPRARRVREAFRLSGHSSSGSSTGSHKERHLEVLLRLGLASRTVFEPRGLAGVVLEELIRVLGAERGFLFLMPDLELLAGRDARGHRLDEEADYSREVVREVADSLEPRVASLGMLRSVLASPLEVGGELRGVIYLDSRLARGVFDTGDVQVVGALAAHIAVALEHTRATQVELRYEAERRQRDLAESLRDLTKELSSTLQTEEVLARFLDGLGRLVPFTGARAELKEVVATRGELAEPKLVIPIVHGESQLGEVLLHRPTPFTPAESELALTLAGQAAAALRNAELFAEVRRRATVDELTGLFNRRHFFERAGQEFHRARRAGEPLAVVMLDVDHFKRFNDTYGHAVGDLVLKRVAGVLAQHVRDIDIVARLGGEEFVVLLPGAHRSKEVAERLRREVEATTLQVDGQSLQVTASLGLAHLGLAHLNPEDEDIDGALIRADQALYRAKAGGRNQVVFSGL